MVVNTTLLNNTGCFIIALSGVVAASVTGDIRFLHTLWTLLFVAGW